MLCNVHPQLSVTNCNAVELKDKPETTMFSKDDGSTDREKNFDKESRVIDEKLIYRLIYFYFN